MTGGLVWTALVLSLATAAAVVALAISPAAGDWAAPMATQAQLRFTENEAADAVSRLDDIEARLDALQSATGGSDLQA